MSRLNHQLFNAYRHASTLGRALPLLLFVWCLLLFVPRIVRTQTPPAIPKRILSIQDNERTMSDREVIDQAFQSAVRSGPPGSVELYDERLEFFRFPTERHAQLMHDYLKQKYEGIKIDAIVTRSDPPLQFMLRYRDEIFPGVPIVYLTARPYTNAAPPNTTGLWGQVALKETLELALHLQPDTKEVLVISGRRNDTEATDAQVRGELQPFESRVKLTYLFRRPFDELLAAVKNLPPHTIVFCPRLTANIGGTTIDSYEALPLLVQASNVPVYSLTDTLVGTGIVGSQAVDSEVLGTELAKVTLEVAYGRRPEDIVVKDLPTAPVVDWRQLRRWNISDDRLPVGTKVRFKQLSFWEQYEGRILVVLGIIAIQFLLIAGLLIERNRKKQATNRLSESEQRFSKAFKANPQPMSITTFADGKYVDVNESFLLMSGFSRDELIGHTSEELMNFEQPGTRGRVITDRLSKSSVVRNFDFQFRTKSGAMRTLLCSAEVIELAGEKCILVASSDITERKVLEQELTQLTGQLFHLQDEERRRIARELHDGTAQNLFAISINLAKLGQLDETENQEMQRLISECTSLGNQSLQEIRTLSYLLHPPLLDQVGLAGALKWYVDGFSKRSGIRVDVKTEPMERLPAETELALFRVVQESLANVSRHSGSGTATVKLERRNGEVLLTIADRGHGLRGPNAVDSPDELVQMGVGIPGMRQRLQQLGGKLELDSNNQGTTVRAVVPLTNGGSHVANHYR